jgi:carbonic anhydrase
MARLTSAVLLSLHFVSALSGAPEVCGAPGDRCAGEESSMLQVMQQEEGTARKKKGGRGKGGFNYRGFQAGEWVDAEAQCGGNSQAPINIAVDGAKYEEMDRKSWPKFSAKKGGCEQAYFQAKDTAWQLDFANEGEGWDCSNLEMEWKDKKYKLLQFHFHTLSEDTVDFQPTAMQMHMVHQADDGAFAVVGVFIKTEGWWKNDFLEDIFKTGFDSNRTVTLPHKQRFNPYKGTLDKFGEFWYYPGSFTTPPCTEGVDFLIAQKPVDIRSCHVKKYMEFLKGKAGNSYGQNHRPIQPLNDRVLTTGRFQLNC